MELRRKIAVLGIVALTLIGIVVVAVALIAGQGPHPTFETYSRLHLGMSKEEVVAILGGPPCNRVDAYKGLPAIRYNDREEPSEGTVCSYYWITDEGFVSVFFDRQGRAVHKTYRPPVAPPRANWLDRLLGRPPVSRPGPASSVGTTSRSR